MEKFNYWSFFLAPGLLFASSLAYIFFGNGMNNGVLGGFIQCAAMFMFIFPMFSITSFINEKLPILSVIFRVLLVFGCLMGFLFGVDSVLNATQPEAYSILEMDHYMYVFMMTFGPIWPLMLGITGIVLGVKKFLRPLPAALLALAGFSFPFGRIPDIAAVYIITDLLMIISFILLADTIYNQSNIHTKQNYEQ